MTQDELKKAAAQAALQFVPAGAIIGVGSGSTVRCFIEALAPIAHTLKGAISSSEDSAARLRAIGINVIDPNDIKDTLPVYIDGADEIDPGFHMIKGGGAALTREKIAAALCERFVCMCDQSKRVPVLGNFPLPIEVIPMAREYLIRTLQKEFNARATWRKGIITDNGNMIIDVAGLRIEKPVELESALNQLPGVVTNGLFARRKADILVLASNTGIDILTP